jgi:signal transduction histidine kinase
LGEFAKLHENVSKREARMVRRALIETANECPLAGALAGRLRDARHDLTLHWLERIVERVSIDRHRVFPSRDLLDHVPLLIDGIADYLEDPAAEVSVDTPVVGKAMELGALRHAQGFDAYEILKEYEILGGILFNYLANAADEMPEPCAKSELLVCGHRLFRAVSIIQQTTTMHFLRLADEAVAEREDRLRAFNRAVSHEIKNRIGTVLGASETLRELAEPAPEQRDKLLGVISRNARLMGATVENLVALSRMEKDARQHRHVRLPEAVKEATRQVREAAQAAAVDVRVAADLPDVEVSAAVVELCLTNYLANAIKYADPRKSKCVAEITAIVEDTPEHGREVVLRLRDNGLGVPPEKRGQLFQRFFRAHETVTGAEGTGLGLSIVRETVESLGGRAWAEFPEDPAGEGGSVFAFSLPYRRAQDERDTAQRT